MNQPTPNDVHIAPPARELLYDIHLANFPPGVLNDLFGEFYESTASPRLCPRGTCVWGSAINVKDRYIYATQPEVSKATEESVLRAMLQAK